VRVERACRWRNLDLATRVSGVSRDARSLDWASRGLASAATTGRPFAYLTSSDLPSVVAAGIYRNTRGAGIFLSLDNSGNDGRFRVSHKFALSSGESADVPEAFVSRRIFQLVLALATLIGLACPRTRRSSVRSKARSPTRRAGVLPRRLADIANTDTAPCNPVSEGDGLYRVRGPSARTLRMKAGAAGFATVARRSLTVTIGLDLKQDSRCRCSRCRRP